MAQNMVQQSRQHVYVTRLLLEVLQIHPGGKQKIIQPVFVTCQKSQCFQCYYLWLFHRV